MATVPKSERTKTRVLREALSLAGSVGFTGLTFGTLAEQAGISKSGLFAHFESKEDLQIQTLHLAEAMFVDRVLRPAVKEPRGVPRIRRLFAGWMDWIHSGTEPRARQAVEAGQFRKKTDAAQFAFEFLGIVHAHHHARRLLRTDQHARRARAAFDRLLETYTR